MIQTFSTGDVSPETLGQIRAVVDGAFGSGFSEDDWDHALGGRHVIAFEDDRVVGHAAVVPRVIETAGRQFHTGYVEAMAVHPGRQREGIGSAVMIDVGSVIHEHFELGALSSSADGFYERLGWERWLGPTHVFREGQQVRSPDDDGGVFVLRFGPSSVVELNAAISCQARSGDQW